MSDEAEQTATKRILRDEKGRIVKGSGPINPLGRPKSKHLTDALSRVLESMPPEEIEAIIRAQIDKALSGLAGSEAALKQLWDRHEGPVTQKVEQQTDLRSYVVMEDGGDEDPGLPEGLTPDPDLEDPDGTPEPSEDD